MSDPIQLIQDRHGKATKGPWTLILWYTTADDGVHCREYDADFIAHAWEDIRTLLAEREALQAREQALTTALREVFTNEVIRAIGALARQQNVCREQGGQVVFVTGMEAAREYIVEHVQLAAQPLPDETRKA